MRITKKMIEKESKRFDGTCPFTNSFSSECSSMSTNNCNTCDLSKKYKKDMIKTILDDWALENIPAPLYRIPGQIERAYYEVVYLLQKIFRKNHISDIETWNTYTEMLKKIYPRLKAFIDLDRSGYPTVYSEYDEHSGYESREQYDKYLKSGDVVGGEMKRWNEDLKEMLFAFEFILHEENEKKFKDFYRKWDIEDPHEEKESNLSRGFIKEKPFYYNSKLDIEYHKRASLGFELFGKRVLNLWD